MKSLSSIQQAVGDWHVSQFGHLGSPDKILNKTKEEAGEYFDDPCVEEAADVVICLCAASCRNGWDLEAAVLAKLEILKGRDQLARDMERGIYDPSEVA